MSREEKVRKAIADSYFWLTECTRTKDEQDPKNPFKPFPGKRYIRELLDFLTYWPKRVKFLEKSRTMLASWTISGWCAHFGFTHEAMKIVFQSQDEARAIHDVQYVKTLWEHSLPELKDRWPLDRPLKAQAESEFSLANGTKFIAITRQPDKIRSEHPTIYVADEAAFMDEGAACFDTAVGSDPLHLIALSSAEHGWFQEFCEPAVPADWPRLAPNNKRSYPYLGGVRVPCKGMQLKLTEEGHAVIRLHYSADPDKDPGTEKGAAWIARKHEEFTQESRFRKEMEIEYDALDGTLVFPEFDEAIHVVPDSEVPNELCIYCSIDPHPRTPDAVLWVGVDAWDDVWVFRELWKSKNYGVPRNFNDLDEDYHWTPREMTEAIAVLEGNEIDWVNPEQSDEYGIYREKPGGEIIVQRFMDQAGKGFVGQSSGGRMELSLADLYTRYGLQLSDPYKSVEAGEDEIRRLLVPRYHSVKGLWPRIHFAASVREIILELKKYRYKQRKTNTSDQELWQEGVKARRHQIDNLRYIVTSDLAFLPSMISRRYQYA